MKPVNPDLSRKAMSVIGGLGFRGKHQRLALAGVLALGCAAQPAHAALTFAFNYNSPGVGFDDPTFGTDRKAALESAAGMLGAYFTNYTATLTYNVNSYSTDDGTLASAGSGVSLVPGTFQQTTVQGKILSNGTFDRNGASADGTINWNFFENWGLTDTPANDEYDFKSTAIHELLHSFGFLSFVDEGGLGLAGNAPGNVDTWATYDMWLTDAAGNPLISNPGGVFDNTKTGTLVGGSGAVLFGGPNAKAANGGNGLPVFARNPWEPGSSIAHLDDDSLVTNMSIMNAYAHGLGLDVRTLSPLELGVLKDIGYTQVGAAAPVPIPAAAWLMGSGLAALLGFGRRRTVD